MDAYYGLGNCTRDENMHLYLFFLNQSEFIFKKIVNVSLVETQKCITTLEML